MFWEIIVEWIHGRHVHEDEYLDQENDDVGNKYLIRIWSLLNTLSRCMGDTSSPNN